MVYELKVAAGHRFVEVPVRTTSGKVWVGKDKVTVTAEPVAEPIVEPLPEG